MSPSCTSGILALSVDSCPVCGGGLEPQGSEAPRNSLLWPERFPWAPIFLRHLLCQPSSGEGFSRSPQARMSSTAQSLVLLNYYLFYY